MASIAAASGLEVHEAGRALRVQTEAPHLVSMGSGRLSTAVTLHPLPEGRYGANLRTLLYDLLSLPSRGGLALLASRQSIIIQRLVWTLGPALGRAENNENNEN